MEAIEKGENIEDNCILSVDDNLSVDLSFEDNVSVDETVEGIYGVITETALTAVVLSSFLLPFFV